jgi:uncharacterized protein (TIGR03083 family)
MEHEQHVSAIRRDSSGLLEAAGEADPHATIDACPDWKPADLVWHIGEVHHFWGTVVAERLRDPDQYTQPDRPPTEDDLRSFARGSAAMLLDALSTTDPSTPVWTWSVQKDAAFVSRRMAMETAVHRVDAERAAGRERRIDPELAADGVDEFLVHFLPDVVDGAPPLGGSVHVHCSDVPGEWTVTVDSGGKYAVSREHAKGDAALRGDAHDLLMVLWRRAPLDSVTVFGDRAIAERLIARTNLD